MSEHKYIVPGLDVLISDPSILQPEKDTKKKAERIYIPNDFLHRVNDFYGEQSSRGDAARELTRLFAVILGERNWEGVYICRNGMEIKFVELNYTQDHFDALDPKSSKGQTLMLVNKLSKMGHIQRGDIAVMTGSDPLMALALLHGFEVEQINPEVYTGRRKVALPLDLSSAWYTKGYLDAEECAQIFAEQPLRLNEYVEFYDEADICRVNNTFANIGRYRGKKLGLKQLENHKFAHPAYQKLYPKTAGQAMLIDALMASPEELPIVIVAGTFGTGKTFLTTAAGYLQTAEKNFETYERVFVCPRDGALGKEIGFVPGDTRDKTRVKAKPIEDNLRAVLRLRDADAKKKSFDSERGIDSLAKRTEDALNRYFEFEPLINMGGRSLSETFIILDEFQDMERHQAKALLSRIGERSKMVVMGDPSQTTNPHLNYTSNGLSYSASKLAGQEGVAVIVLGANEIVRSSAAQRIAKCFD